MGIQFVRERALDIILFFVVLVMAWVPLAPIVEKQVFFIDEYEFVRKSYLFDTYFLDRNIDAPLWTDAAIESDAPQPKVGPYIFGLALHLSGVSRIENALSQSGFNTITIHGRPWWVELWLREPREFPPELSQSLSFIMTARRVAVLFGAVSVILMFLIGTAVWSSVFGFFAALLLAGNTLFRLHSGFAMTDTMQLAFFLCTILLLLIWREAWSHRSQKKLYLISVAVGFSAALAAGVKVTGVLAFLFVLVHHGFMLLSCRDSVFRRQLFTQMIVTGFVFSVVFYVLHPFLYVDTLHKLVYMYQARFDVARTAYAVEYPDTFLPTRAHALWYIFVRTLLPNAQFGNFSNALLPIDAILFLWGGFYMVRSLFASWKPGEIFPKLAVLPLWISFTFVALVWYLRNDWSRYYLPFVSGISIIQGYALSILFFRLGGGAVYELFGYRKGTN